MFVQSLYNYFHNFRRPARYATMKIEIVIENGWNLKLCQMWLQAFSRLLLNHHQTHMASPRPT